MGSQPKPSLLARRSIVKAAYQVVLTDTAMRAAVAVCLLAGTSQAVDFRQIMQIQAMQSRFQQDKIDSTQQKAMMNLAGFEDMQLFYSGAIDSSVLKQSMKQQYKDQMIQNMLNNGGYVLPRHERASQNDHETGQARRGRSSHSA